MTERQKETIKSNMSWVVPLLIFGIVSLVQVNKRFDDIESTGVMRDSVSIWRWRDQSNTNATVKKRLDEQELQVNYLSNRPQNIKNAALIH